MQSNPWWIESLLLCASFGVVNSFALNWWTCPLNAYKAVGPILLVLILQDQACVTVCIAALYFVAIKYSNCNNSDKFGPIKSLL